MSGLLETLLPFAIFGLVAAVGIWLTTFLSGRTTRAMERLYREAWHVWCERQQALPSA